MHRVRQTLVLPQITLAITGNAGENVITAYQDIGNHDFTKQLTLVLENNEASDDLDVFYRLGYAIRGIHDNFQEVIVATAGGLDDIAYGAGSKYSGKGFRHFRVQIDGEGSPDTFKWTRDVEGGTWDEEGVNVSDAADGVLLAEGVRVLWAATTGHTTGNYWDIYNADVYFDAWVQAVTAANIPAVGSVPGIDISNINLAGKPIRYIQFKVDNDGAAIAVVRLIMITQV